MRRRPEDDDGDLLEQPACIVRRSSQHYLPPERLSSESEEKCPEVDEDDRIRDLIFVDVHAVPEDDDDGDNRVQFLRCVVERTKVRRGQPISVTMSLESTRLPLMVAKRHFASGNYHIYDVSRGSPGSKLTKKGGDYIGKIKGASANEPRYHLFVDNSKEEVALFMHRRTRTISALVGGAKPRQICVVFPKTTMQNLRQSEESATAVLLEKYFKTDPDIVVLNERPPKLVDGQYSLNFNGRAKISSVKNCQIVENNRVATSPVLLQIGKVGADRFNLDFRAPFSPKLAFALAISQFIP